jgi:hypothetical protein
MKISLKDKLIVDYDGTPIPDEKGTPLTFRKVLANILKQDGKEDNPVKVYELGKKVALDDTVDFDTSDTELVERVVKASQYVALVKGQILLALKAK